MSVSRGGDEGGEGGERGERGGGGLHAVSLEVVEELQLLDHLLLLNQRPVEAEQDDAARRRRCNHLRKRASRTKLKSEEALWW